ncbi:50S ribosomal protein L13 [Candidatus Nanohalococcus occultus]|uniref:Large ribosomal subunit protein uL13 n=1 Tax=Candidatus Nanohalococcus occultus TaxID=2978047 RepID=A0ABY8CHE1_9ARCH|nr:Ribosomal protein L13 [Candidatus Nanohaloarchaeota archaeon SVXNc]
MSLTIDAEGKILGRLATKIAREAKDGKEVNIVNADKVVISGSKEEVIANYRQKYERGTRHDGPYYPKAPHKILKRTVRNMLPYKSKEGREAFSRVKAYLGVPHDMEEITEVDVKEGDDLRYRNYVKLGEVSKSIGWTPRGDLK